MGLSNLLQLKRLGVRSRSSPVMATVVLLLPKAKDHSTTGSMGGGKEPQFPSRSYTFTLFEWSYTKLIREVTHLLCLNGVTPISYDRKLSYPSVFSTHQSTSFTTLLLVFLRHISLSPFLSNLSNLAHNPFHTLCRPIQIPPHNTVIAL